MVDLESLKKLGAYGPILVAYAFGLSLIYAWTYWSAFGVNILEWIDLGDIFKLGVASLTVLLVGVGLILLGMWIVFEPIGAWPFLIGEEEEADKHRLLKWATYALTLVALAVGLALIYWAQMSGGIGVVAAAILVSARRMEWLTKAVPDRRVRTLVVAAIGMAPIFVLSWALRSYILTESGERYTAIDAQELEAAGAKMPSGIEGELKVIGIAHDRMFLLRDAARAEDRRILIVPLAGLAAIQTRRVTRKAPVISG